MKNIAFEWDKRKSDTNLKKHGISFEEAQTVFLDEEAYLFHDPEHSEKEDRYLLLGISRHLRLLIVCHCYKEEDNVIRLISARKATKHESKSYGGAT